MTGHARIMALLLLLPLSPQQKVIPRQEIVNPAPAIRVERRIGPGRDRVHFRISETLALRGIVSLRTRPASGVASQAGLLDDNAGSFVVAERNGRWVARVHVGDDVYKIEQVRGGRGTVLRVPPEPELPCGLQRQEEQRRASESPVSSPAIQTDPCAYQDARPTDPCWEAEQAMVLADESSGGHLAAACSRLPEPRPATATIEALVVYTSDLAAHHTAEEIEDDVFLSIEETNLSFELGKIPAHLRLATRDRGATPCISEVPYQDGDIDADLKALLTRGEGVLDEVHSLRRQCNADVVLMLVDDDATEAGMACVMKLLTRAYADYALAVVRYASSVNHYTFTHELGHMMGGGHDKRDACQTGMCADAAGWHAIYDSNGRVIRFKTMMAYGGEKTPYFSDPDIRVRNLRAGTRGANNARTLRISARAVSNFRP